MIKRFFQGILMGIADLIPGFSAGTMAITLGIYDKLISIIGFFFQTLKKWKENLLFLFPVVLGMLVSLILFSGIFKYLLTHYRVFTFSFFIGIVIATTTHIYRAHFKNNISQLLTKKSNLFSLLIGLLIPLLMVFFALKKQVLFLPSEVFLYFHFKIYFLLFIVGMIGSIAMILPGISGSLILILLGFYDAVIGMIQPNVILSYLFPILVFGLGIIIGLILASFSISKLIKIFPFQTISFMIGILIGSFIYMLSIEIFKNNLHLGSFVYNITSLLLIIMGFIFTHFFGKIDKITP
jgi:putative membrane protein